MKRLSSLAFGLLILGIWAPTAVAAPASPFTGSWYGFDPAPPTGDGSLLYLEISGGASAHITFSDTHGTICHNSGAPTMFFSAKLSGMVTGTHLEATYRSARCGATSFDAGGWATTYHYDAATDTLYDGFATFYRR